MGEYKAYAFTVRPKNGIVKGSPLERDLEKWIKSKDYGCFVYEMEDEARHLHGCVFLNEACKKGNIAKALKRIQSRTDPDWSAAAHKVLQNGLKIMYNDDFIDEYMIKDNPLSYDNRPDRTDDFYPSDAEQDRVMAKSNAVDQRYHRISTMYLDEHTGVICPSPKLYLKHVALWVFDAMFIRKTIAVIQSGKNRKEFVECLYMYIYGERFPELGFMITEENEAIIQAEIEHNAIETSAKALVET